MKRPSIQRQLLGQIFVISARIYFGFSSKAARERFIMSLNAFQKIP